MFTGPGAEPLLAAGAAWNTLAEELAQSATSFGSVTSALASGSWLGASSAAMMAVAAQYVGWLRTAAAQAEAAAGKATAVAVAYEAAQTATVQPAVVAANRGLVRVLAATNWLGQNAPAIADIEAAYEQMWAMDVAAMSHYHADAAALLAQLPSWDQVLDRLDTDKLGFGKLGRGILVSANSCVGSPNSGTGKLGGLLGVEHVSGGLTSAHLGASLLNSSPAGTPTPTVAGTAVSGSAPQPGASD